jgi:hypothetical protein
MKLYDKNDVKEGDVYCFFNNFIHEDDRETVLAEIKRDKDNELYAESLRHSYWKPQYGYLKNDYLTDFEAVLVYRQY